MNLLNKVIVEELRKNPFGNWRHGKTSPEQIEADYLAIPLPFYKRETDPDEIIYHMNHAPTRIFILKNAFYLGLQGNSSAEVKSSLKSFSQKSIDLYTEIINYIHAHYDITRSSLNPLKEILFELIMNAFEASIKYVDPKFKIDRSKNTKEQEKQLKEILISIEKNYPQIMQFSISLAKEKIRKEQLKEEHKKKSEEEKEVIVPALYKINSLKFVIISPPINPQDRLKLEEKLSIHARYKENGRGYLGYLNEEYDPEALDSHELGVLNILNMVDTHWKGDAKIFYEFSDKETRTNLIVNTRK